MAKPFEHELENHPEMVELLNSIGNRIGKDMPPGWGFTLLLFEYTPGDSLFYISSAQHQNIIQTMREFIKKYGEN